MGIVNSFPPLDEPEDECYDEPYDAHEDDDAGELSAELLTLAPEPDAPRLAPEPLFSALFKHAFDRDDTVLQDYAEHVAPRLSWHLAHVTAKGGEFAARHREEGRARAEHYSDDQSMRAHLLNGLLPTVRIARLLRRWQVPTFEDEFDDRTYRLFCAGFTLHDWLKLPDVGERLAATGLRHDSVNAAQHLPLVEDILRGWCESLGLDAFLAPLGPIDQHLHDLIYIACNTQVKWGTMHNLRVLCKLHAPRRRILLATELATLADYLAYLGRTPVDVVAEPAIQRKLEAFSPDVRLTYHHLADVRGVLTNIINNAAVAAYAIPDQREPLLYAPTGVVYLERRTAPPPPPVAAVAEAAIERIRNLCGTQLAHNLTGFGRDGKGLKYAAYYNLFFSPRQLALLVARVAERRIVTTLAAASRYEAILTKGMLPDDPALAATVADLRATAGLEVDRLAEGCALLAKLAADYAPDFDAVGWLLDQLGATDARTTMQLLNAHRRAGGVPYGWYYAAGLCRRSTPGLDEQQWAERLHTIAASIAAHLPDTAPTDAPGWQEIARYIQDHLRFKPDPANDLIERMRTELQRYTSARKSGRGALVVCSLCSSPYSISEQREAAILFAPMVYTNKQPLHSSKAIRHICAVCSTEMMLRQLLMKRGRDSGKNFEGRRLRYLFFYPTYFYTPETLRMLRRLYTTLRQVNFTRLRKLLYGQNGDGPMVDLTPQTFQSIQDLLLDPAQLDQPEQDRLFRLHYEDLEPVTFGFVGLPPQERDAKDAEAWITPAFLALLLPLLLDIKVVASESMLPLFSEATELPETVAFDGAHAFVNYLVGKPRLTLDDLMPALQRLTAAYLVHLDGNAGMSSGGYAYHWNALPALARNLATSPLYMFHYLKKGLRQGESDTISPTKAALYLELFAFVAPKGDDWMTHARHLTDLYRLFYRAKRHNSNAILRPLSLAARALLDAHPHAYQSDANLVDIVRGELHAFLERVNTNRADGYFPKGSTHESREQAVIAFSEYLVYTLYRDAFGGDRAALRGKQLNLLKNACEVVYLDAQRREWQARAGTADDTSDDDLPDEPTSEFV